MESRISHFEIKGRLGQGGMGEVYSAVDLRLDRKVALKRVRPGDPGSAGAELMEEARRAASVRHPRLPVVLEVGEWGDGAYLAMELIEGEPLSQVLGRGPLGLESSLAAALQVCEALAAIHAAGLVHGDLSSANVMRLPDGGMKLLDFGLARTSPIRPRRIPNPLEAGGSRPEGPAGTASCLAPELLRGEGADSRADLFATGVLLYEMLTGANPFARDSPAATFEAILQRDPAPIGIAHPEVPFTLERIVIKALSKDPSQRFSTAVEMASELRRLQASPPRVARRGGVDPPSPPRPERNWGPASGGRIGPHRWAWYAAVAGSGVGSLLVASLLRPHGWEWAWVLLPAGLAGSILLARAHRLTFRIPSAPTPTEAAFRGLMPFQERDRDQFFGRRVEAESLRRMLTQKDLRFGVVLGESGCGKTSLLCAEVIPGLWDEGFMPIYCRSYLDPLPLIAEEARRHSQIEQGAGEDLTAYLGRVATAMNSTVVILCDQFEELFVNLEAGEREPFLAFVGGLCSDTSVRARLVVSIRSDFLHLLASGFAGRIVEPLASRQMFQLRHLDPIQAEDIIQRSAGLAGLQLEEGFSRYLAKDLAVGGKVLPSELQIVGEQLQRRRIYSTAEYQKAGGKARLVHGFLDDVIRLSGDQDGAARLLRCLISDENTRLVLTWAEILRRTQLGEGRLRWLLDRFVQSRLLREVQEASPWRYELVHEYLIHQLNALTGKAMDAKQRANRLLRQFLANYQVDPRTRIPLTKLFTIQRHADRDRSELERRLFGKSLRWGLLRTFLIGSSVAFLSLLGVGYLSIGEHWETSRLQDGHTAAARQVVFSPDGKWLASAGEDGQVNLWEFATRRRVAVRHLGQVWVTAIAFSPDGHWLASGGSDRLLRIWAAADLAPSAVLGPAAAPIAGLAFAPRGDWLVATGSGAQTGFTSAWQAGSWRKAWDFPEGLAGDYGNVLFAPGRERVLGVGASTLEIGEGRPRVGPPFNLATGNWRAISRDGTRTASVDADGTVELWDIQKRSRIAVRPRAHHDHGRGIAFSPDGRLIASCAEDVVLWDAATLLPVSRLEHSAIVWGVAFSPDGNWLVSCHGDGSLLVWDVRARRLSANLKGHAGPVRAVAFSPDGRQAATAGDDFSVLLWELPAKRRTGVLIGHASRITAVDFSGDGRWIASADLDGRLILWELGGERPRARFTIEPGRIQPIYALAFAPDSLTLATSNGIYRIPSGAQIRELSVPLIRGSVYALAFSPDGKELAIGDYRGQLLVLATGTWKPIEQTCQEQFQPISMTYTPDGRQFLTGDDQGEIWLWNRHPVGRISLVGRHSARIKDLALSPDGRQLATASDDQTIALWDIEKRRLVGRIGTHTSPVLAVAFARDGKQLMSGEHDHSVRLHARRRTLWGWTLE